MDTLRQADLAARVVAWHNRHPLARRITPDQVVGIGAVSLPFALRESAADGAPADSPELTPIFDAQWMYRADMPALGHFAAAHGAYPLDAAARWPWRHVDANLPRAHRADAQGLEGRTVRHLLSALIEVDGRRSRVLVAPTSPLKTAAVFGRRLFDPTRVARGMGLGAVSACALAATVALYLIPGTAGEAPETGMPAMAAASGAVAIASAGESASPHAGPAPQDQAPHAVADHGHDGDHTEQASQAPPHGETPAPHHPPAVAHDAGPTPDTPRQTFQPVDVGPMVQDAAAAGPLVSIRPALTEDERRHARVQAATLRPDPAASAVGQSLLKGPVYALATLPLRSRDDAQAQQVLLHGLKAQVATPVPTHLDVMPAGQRWRVVWWPHPQADEAERLRVEARARGLKLEVIAF